MTPDQTSRVLDMRDAILGESMTVRRALPHRQQRTVGAWCFMDHAGPVQFDRGDGMHVGPHPHIGLQTFTWMIEGEVMHRDSLDNEQIIRPGQVNLMTAGRGIAHTEDSLKDGSRLHAAQLWIALPESRRHGPPAFEHHAVLPQESVDGFTATVLIGSALGRTAPTTAYSPLLGMDWVSRGPAQTHMDLRTDFEHAVIPLRGQVQAGDELLQPGSWLYLPTGRDRLSLQTPDASQFLLLGGTPFEEPLIIWWNLVARTEDEIRSALENWESGQFAPVRPGSPAGPLPAPSLQGVRLKARG